MGEVAVLAGDDPGRLMPFVTFLTRCPSLTARAKMRLSTRCTLRTVAGADVLLSAATQACTSACETSAKATSAQRGSTCSRRIPAYRSAVDGLRWACRSSQLIAQVPIVSRARAGSM